MTRPFDVETCSVLSGVLMAILPTYSSIGIWASVLLMLLRLAQGISMGGETAFNGVYAVELPAKRSVGRFGGWLMSGVMIGNLAGTASVFVLVEALGSESMTEWGWCIPFALSGLVAVFVMWMRRTVPETLTVEKDSADERPTSAEVWRGLGNNWFRVLVVVFVVGGVQIVNYGWTVGLPNLAISQFNEDDGAVFGVSTAPTAMIMVLSPIAGGVADRWRISRVYIWSRLACVPLAFGLSVVVKSTETVDLIWLAAGRVG